MKGSGLSSRAASFGWFHKMLAFLLRDCRFEHMFLPDDPKVATGASERRVLCDVTAATAGKAYD